MINSYVNWKRSSQYPYSISHKLCNSNKHSNIHTSFFFYEIISQDITNKTKQKTFTKTDDSTFTQGKTHIMNAAGDINIWICIYSWH